MNEIYDRLQKLGYSRDFLRQTMPDWWTEETDADRDCLLDGCLHLSRWLGLNIRALLDPSSGRLLRENPWAQLPNEDDRDRY
jgi:hypothetical protein